MDRSVKSVAIVAMGHSRAAYISEASTKPSEWTEVWTLNGLAGVLCADRLFLMDDLEIQQLRSVRNPYVRVLLDAAKKATVPVYTARKVEGYPNLVEYPLESVAGVLGLPALYATNSVPYMVAMAIAEGFERIGIYGCDYTYGDGRTEKGRACLEWWCGFAAARGVQIHVPATSSLLESGKPQLYGYWAEDIKMEAGRVTRSLKDTLPSAEEVEAAMAHKK
jgi:hypothetical protein